MKPMRKMKPGFRYVKLGKTLPTKPDGTICEDVSFADLARLVYLMVTGVPIPKKPRRNNPLLGVHRDVAIYLLFDGKLGSGNRVFRSVDELGPHPTVYDGPRIVVCEEADFDPIEMVHSRILVLPVPKSINPNGTS